MKENVISSNEDILIEMALLEDLDGVGDVTSSAVFSDETDEFYLISKSEGVLCGRRLFEKVMAKVDPSVNVSFHFSDGDALKKGDCVADVSGKVLSILQGERTAINFLSHLSAVATKTARLVKAAEGKVRILDTRKTLPGYRLLQKYAVRCGGGENHRIGLFDMVLIKDNHQDAAGGLTAAVGKVRAKWGDRYAVEVEVRNADEVKEALACRVDRIMFDNMSDVEMKAAAALVAGRCETEASGNMNLGRLDSVKNTGVDFVSFGELTHSVEAFDFSLRKQRGEPEQ